MTAEWNDRLITRARALELAGRWPIYMDADDYPGPVNMIRCCECNGNCGRFGDGQATVEQILSGVLRHLVMVHDVSLSGRDNGGDRPAASADTRLAGDTRGRSESGAVHAGPAAEGRDPGSGG